LGEKKQFIETFLARYFVQRRHQHRGVNRAAFQRHIARCAAADLQEGNVLLRIQAIFSQNYYGLIVRGAAEAADADALSFAVFHSLDAWIRNKRMVRAIHERHHNADRQSALGSADGMHFG
jgi:hypothetical protein